MVDILPNDSQAMAIALVGRGQRVLELGCGEGHVTRQLTANGCKVTAIEIDPAAAEVATEHATEVHVADLDRVSPSDVVGDRRFERIVVGDVFEHLKDPTRTLMALAAHLTTDGFLVASIPNVTHADVRLMLLNGQWRYQDLGLLDRTHLRFFDFPGILELFATAGWRIDRVERTTKPALDSELARLAGPASRIDGVLEAIAADPESQTYQFVVMASPGEARSDAREHFATRYRSTVTSTLPVDTDRLLAENAQLRVRTRELEERLEDALWVKAIWRQRLERIAAIPRRASVRVRRTVSPHDPVSPRDLG